MTTPSTVTRAADTDAAAIESFARALPDFLSKGGKVSELLGYQANALEAGYAHAHGLYEQERYADALSLFSFLSFNDALEPRYLWGMGACNQMLSRHREAMHSYATLVAMDMCDPAPTYRIAECLVALEMRAEAVQTLRVVIDLADEDCEVHRTLRRRATAMLQLMGEALVEESA